MYNSSDWPALPPLSALVNQVHHCEALELLAMLPDNSVDCVVTSPPYFGLRDYGVAGQIGLEPTPAAYVQTLVTLFREVRRVLKDSGTFWLNLGDSYSSSSRTTGRNDENEKDIARRAAQYSTGAIKALKGGNAPKKMDIDFELPSKNLLLIPHRVAIALQDDGWICRQDNVWAKPNPMPESVTDRTTRAHEYIFQFVKSGRYYYNAEAILEPLAADSYKKLNGSKRENGDNKYSGNYGGNMIGHSGITANGSTSFSADGRNKRSVWTISPAKFREAHFATFPFEIPETCIRAGCPVGGLVLDPFMGSGTTALVARAEGRQFIGSELNAEYIGIIEKRLNRPYTPQMFLDYAEA